MPRKCLGISRNSLFFDFFFLNKLNFWEDIAFDPNGTVGRKKNIKKRAQNALSGQMLSGQKKFLDSHFKGKSVSGQPFHGHIRLWTTLMWTNPGLDSHFFGQVRIGTVSVWTKSIPGQPLREKFGIRTARIWTRGQTRFFTFSDWLTNEHSINNGFSLVNRVLDR